MSPEFDKKEPYLLPTIEADTFRATHDYVFNQNNLDRLAFAFETEDPLLHSQLADISEQNATNLRENENVFFIALFGRELVRAQLSKSSTVSDQAKLPTIIPDVLVPVTSNLNDQTYMNQIFSEAMEHNELATRSVHAFAQSSFDNEHRSVDATTATVITQKLLNEQMRHDANTPREVKYGLAPYLLPVVDATTLKIFWDKVAREKDLYLFVASAQAAQNNPGLYHLVERILSTINPTSDKRLATVANVTATAVYQCLLLQDLKNNKISLEREFDNKLPDLSPASYELLINDQRELGEDIGTEIIKARLAYHNPHLNRFMKQVAAQVAQTKYEYLFARTSFTLVHEAYRKQMESNNLSDRAQFPDIKQ